MTSRHGWLRFRSTGHPLRRRLDDDARAWQADLLADHRRWYGAPAPEQVSGAFVLQYLLQVPAHTAALAAGAGMRVQRLADLTFETGPSHTPRLVETGRLEPGAETLEVGLARAEGEYRAVAEPLAGAYVSTRRMSSQQRQGMVGDMWLEAARLVRSRAGAIEVGEPRRRSCCLIYALPGCVECAACPRLSRPRADRR